ncbi:MAG: YIP1 family protein [Gemmatimonadetes bacterium]|nr:YIP1 family protein [Gemmatimonadota bacterium]
MLGAATLNVATYEDVEADRTATGQAATVVAIVAVAAAIGGAGGGIVGIVGGLLSAFLGWAVFSGLAYLVGVHLFGGTADWGEVLRTTGFARAPGVFLILGFIPVLGGLIGFVVWIWQLVTGVVAVRQALDISTGKAVLTALIANLPYLLWLMFVAGLAFMAGVLGAAR